MAEVLGRVGVEQLVALAISLCACATDLRTRRIPNALSLGNAVAALVYALAVHGLGGFANGFAGCLVGFVLFLPFFLLGGLGAGDVKLMACIGAWLGPSLAVWTALYGAVAGGVLGLAVAFATGYLRVALDNVYMLLVHFRVAGVRPHPELTLTRGPGPRLPYAVPIAAGVIAAIWLR